MTKPRFLGPALLALFSCLGYSQDISVSYVLHPNQEVRVRQLPSLMAHSEDPSDVLLTSLDTVFHDREVCCGKDSALEDQATRVDPLSLKDIASRLQGRHLLSDGRPIAVSADFWPASSGDAGYRIVSALTDKHALLMVWNSHLYVLYGVLYDQRLYSDGTSMSVIKKLYLLDTRFSDARRNVVFDRETDDWGKVQGTLQLAFALQ